MMDRIDPILVARDLHREYGSGAGLVRAVRGVDLEVELGESVAIMGASGCGKSTLLHLLGGLERPSSGELRLGGRRLDDMSERELAHLRRTAIGFVFQAFHLVPELTAVENVELPALLAGQSPRFARGRAMELLEQVGLSNRSSHLPSALSGGQLQRVAIARALSNEPEIVLADEPTGNLDSSSTIEVLRLLEQLRERGLTLLIVTHDERVAATADRLISMRDGGFVEETRLRHGSANRLNELVGLEVTS
jgi:putative ABC transport system ATP-binding protein